MEGIVCRILRLLPVMVALVGILLIRPGDAQAGLMDFIWDMSGPQMIGGTFRCRIPVGGGATKCSAVGYPVFGVDKFASDVMTERRTWVNLGAALYTSTGKNDGDTNYRAWRTEMVSFEPMVEHAWVSNARFRVFQGAGGTFQFLFGPDVPDAFGNAGFKLRLIGVEIGDLWEVAFNMRLYPDGFGSDQFGFGPSPPGDRPFETTLGASFTYKVRKFWGN